MTVFIFLRLKMTTQTRILATRPVMKIITYKLNFKTLKWNGNAGSDEDDVFVLFPILYWSNWNPGSFGKDNHALWIRRANLIIKDTTWTTASSLTGHGCIYVHVVFMFYHRCFVSCYIVFLKELIFLVYRQS